MLGKWLYLEFLIPLKDYVVTLKSREGIFDWVLPTLIAVFAYMFILRGASYTSDAKDFIGQVLNVLGILIGFSIASVTLLLTSTSDTIKKLKEHIARRRKVGGLPISSYQLTLITFSALLFIEISGALVNLFYGLAASVNVVFRYASWKFFYTFDCFLVSQVLALNIRNITNLYLVFLEQPKSNHPGV